MFDYSESYRALKNTLENNSHEIAAFILEPIISGGGMYKIPDNFMKNAISLCHQHDVFVVFDECQTGSGRLGKWYSFSDKDFLPDFVISGKSIGLGLPVSTVTANGDTVDVSSITMEHFSSHQNEAFSAIIVKHFISWIIEDKKFDYINSAGSLFLNELKNIIGNSKTMPRGEGLMLGFDLTQNTPSNETKSNGNLFISIALDQGLLLQHCNYGRTIRVLPNYNITEKEIGEFIVKLQKTFKIYEKNY
jgi:acetylornithine/succinyldiaminopimelate/putrescine aminotransferase